MRTFSEWTVKEGLWDLAPAFQKVYSLYKELQQKVSGGLDAALAYIRDTYPDIWEKVLKLAGDKGALQTLEVKTKEAQPQATEGIDPALTGDALRQFVQMFSSLGPILSMVGYGIAAAVFILLSFKYRTSISSVGSLVLGMGGSAAKSVKARVAPGDSPELARMKAEREQRDKEAEALKRKRMTMAPKQAGRLPQPPSRPVPKDF